MLTSVLMVEKVCVIYIRVIDPRFGESERRIGDV